MVLVAGTALLAFAAIAQIPPALPAGSPAPDAAAATPEPKFDIHRFVVEGATLLRPAEIAAATTPFVGKDRDFAAVQRALEALERAYTAKGYSAVQVILPEQELERGEVHFKVIEARIGKLIIEGNKFFDEANIRASLPSLVPGKSPNIHDVAENLRLINESPAKQTTVLMRGGSEEGVVDALARVADDHPRKYSVTLDNTGTQQTGTFRIGFGFQHGNLRNRDHVLSMQYVTAPNDEDRTNRLSVVPSSHVTILGAALHVPLYKLGDSLDFSFGYSNVNSGVVLLPGASTAFNVSGSGTVAGVRYNKYLRKWGEVEQKISVGLDYRAYQSFVAALGNVTSLVPDMTVHPFSATYLGVYRSPSSETSFNAGWLQNLPGGNDGGSSSFDAARSGARARYLVWRYGINHNRAFANDWQMRVGFSGQATRDKLIPGEQFGVGGMDSVRGFLEREVANDNGYRGTLELYSPDFAGKFRLLSGMRARGVAFTDWGAVRRMEPGTAELHSQHIGGAGFGVRMSRGTNLSFRFDYAVVTDKGGLQGRGDGRVHAAFSYVF